MSGLKFGACLGEVFPAFGGLGFGRSSTKSRQVNFLDDACIVGIFLDELCELTLGIDERVGDRRSVDEAEGLGETDLARSLAFARGFASGPAEEVEEAAAGDRGIGQRSARKPTGTPGKLGRRPVATSIASSNSSAVIRLGWACEKLFESSSLNEFV